MSQWYWKVIALKAVFAFTCFAPYIKADDNIKKLPFCNPSNLRDGPAHNDLMIVSTLDGKLTAFSTQNGIKAWDIETQPLLSSNLHNLELTFEGKWVRLVPSLRGTIYSLSGENIEPLPFDAEQLLSSSYKYNDDMVIAGSRETVWVGIDANTGDVIYECGSSGCNIEHAATSGSRDVIVLRRHSNIVRAVDPRMGTEKWNFSVAEHHLALNQGECIGGRNSAPAPQVAVAVAIHDARVALYAAEDSGLMWQQKLEAPVAGMWRLQGGSLQSIDVVWRASETVAGVHRHPSLYIGVHNSQLYIQESPLYTRKLESAMATSKTPWKLITGRPLLESDTALSVTDSSLTVNTQDVSADKSLSQVALYGPKGLAGDYGFFLFVQETCDQAVQTAEGDTVDRLSNAADPHDHHHIHVHVYSLWYWWKEVLVIAVTSALFLNVIIWPHYFAPRASPPDSKSTSVTLTKSDLVTHYESPTKQMPPSYLVSMPNMSAALLPAERPPGPEYSGRYETDFTPLRCLGKGGFGVVFEVRNNIDHCTYALKRITLPQKETKRERVRREVRALAKLDHANIVRYFNAWEERPPPPALAIRDRDLIRELDGTSELSEEYPSSPVSKAKLPRGKGDSVVLNLHKPFNPFSPFTEDFGLQELSRRNRCDPPNVHQAGRRHPSDGKRSLPAVLDDVTVDVADKPPSLSCSDGIIFDANAPDGDHTSNDVKHTIDDTRENNTIDNTRDNTIDNNTMDKQSIDKRLSRVLDSEYKTDSTNCKKKKGHRRHWSLDACVKSEDSSVAPSPLYLYIQMQLCLRDTLHDWLQTHREQHQRPYLEIKSLFRQIVSAVDYVHKAGLIHRDLKPRNILFSQDGTVKVGDFGLVTSMGDTSQDGEQPAAVDAHTRHTRQVGTELYMSPEQLQGRPYSYKVDIYSLGLILFELLYPFGTDSERVHRLKDVRDGIYPQHFKDQYPSETEALELMLCADPSRRPTALGVQARAPLFEPTDPRYHFVLPPTAGSA